MINFGIIGYGRMGKIYHKELTKLGCKLIAIRNSSKKSSLKSIKKLQGVEFFNFSKKNLISKIKFLVISTPFKYNLKYLTFFLKKNIYILCEKPLFYQKNSNLYKDKIILKNILKKNKKKLFLNLSNEYLGTIYKKKIKIENTDNIFYFYFYTKGKYEYNHIILDLVPHFFSIFQKIVSLNIFKILNIKIKKNYSIIFIVSGKYYCKIYLRQGYSRNVLRFGFKNKLVTREQIKTKGGLKLFLRIGRNERIYILNPFVLYLKNVKKLIKHSKYTNSEKFFYDITLKSLEVFNYKSKIN